MVKTPDGFVICEWVVLVRYPHEYAGGLLVPYARVPAIIVAWRKEWGEESGGGEVAELGTG